MKKTVTLLLALISNIALAAPPQCDVWEYARLKDSTKTDLVSHACESKKAADANNQEKYALLGNMTAPGYMVDQVSKAEAVCRDQVKVTKSVYEKKFGKALPEGGCDSQK